MRDLEDKQAGCDLQGRHHRQLGALGSETTTIGSSGTFAGGMPQDAQVSIGNVPFAVTTYHRQQAAAPVPTRPT